MVQKRKKAVKGGNNIIHSLYKENGRPLPPESQNSAKKEKTAKTVKNGAPLPQEAENDRRFRGCVLGVDPGINGAFVVTDGSTYLQSFPMPIEMVGTDKSIHFDGVMTLLKEITEIAEVVHVFLERAVPFKMGTKGAFSYGRGFEVLNVSLRLTQLPVTLVEPAKWTKEMCEGINADLRPKARSLIAVKRLYPTLVRALPTRPKGGLLDGPVDALLIAGYGLRRLRGYVVPPPKKAVEDVGDFY